MDLLCFDNLIIKVAQSGASLQSFQVMINTDNVYDDRYCIMAILAQPSVKVLFKEPC